MSLAEQLHQDKRALVLPLQWAWSQLCERRFREHLLLLILETYAVVRASVPLMEQARAQLGADDPLAAWLAVHEDEERGHEAWVVDDLVRLGADADAVRRTLPLRQTAAIPGTAHYLIAHRGPHAVLGYMHALEGTGMRPQDVADIAAQAGLPLDGLGAFTRHAAIDPDHHLASIDRALDAQRLDDALVRLAHRAALEAYAELYLAIARCPDEGVVDRLARVGLAGAG